MTDTVLKNAFLGANSANSVNPVLKAAANAQKAAGSASGKTQDFGAVLDKTAQKYEQKSEKTVQAASDSSANSQTQQATAGTDTDPAAEETSAVINEQTSDTEAAADAENVASDAKEAAQEPVGEIQEMEEPVDEMTIDAIARALEQIIEQIREILGITDEELLSGMEDLGLQSYDLLNADNMAQLVAAISGEDSAISLVANEDLYNAMQDITELVDTQVDSLLENTGLTSEELDTVLQKLQEMATQKSDDQQSQEEQAVSAEEQPLAETLPAETVEEPGIDEQVSNGPVFIKEDNTRTDNQPAKQYDKLPENQQENLTDIGAKPQTQNTDKDTKGSDDKDSRSFEQHNTAQNFQNQPGEVSDAAAAAESVEKFTSESTENIIRQLADMVKLVKNENLTQMELQLHPASLGTVNVSLTTKSGMVTAEFTTQNEAVKAAIEAQATQLRANLEEQGVRVEAIEVSVESHQMERNLDKNGDQQQKQSQEQEAMRVQGMRRSRSRINLRAFTDGEELEGEMQGADDATRIAMEIMAANGNTMDLLV